MVRNFLLALISLIGLVSCSETDVEISWSSTGTESSLGAFGASGGGYRVDTDKPAIFYGTVVEQGRRRYTYLILARALELPGSGHEHLTSGSTQVDGDSLLADHSLSVQGIELAARFEARTSTDRGVLEDPVLSLQGEVIEPEAGWFFLFDGEDPTAGVQPLTLEMPDLPTELEALADITERWIDEAIEANPTMAEFLDS